MWQFCMHVCIYVRGIDVVFHVGIFVSTPAYIPVVAILILAGIALANLTRRPVRARIRKMMPGMFFQRLNFQDLQASVKNVHSSHFENDTFDENGGNGCLPLFERRRN